MSLKPFGRGKILSSAHDGENFKVVLDVTHFELKDIIVTATNETIIVHGTFPSFSCEKALK